MENGLGFANFLAQIDEVGMVVLALLVSLSVASWYLIMHLLSWPSWVSMLQTIQETTILISLQQRAVSAS